MKKLSIAVMLYLIAAANAAAGGPVQAMEMNPWTGKQRELKNLDPQLLSVVSFFARHGSADGMIRNTRDSHFATATSRTPQIAARGLRNPQGVAVHPTTGVLYVSQDNTLVSALVDGKPVTVIDASTPVYMNTGSVQVRDEPLQMLEAIAFSPAGDLYVAESRPGGRLVRFALDANGKGIGGEEVWIPGGWPHVSWEAVAAGPRGELLLSGSSAEDAITGDAPAVFEGVLLYRDRDYNWWLLDHRPLRSFSPVAFSRDGTKIVYACEVTGEINWMDLGGRKLRWGSSVNYAAKTAEGICVLPDGRILVAEERGKFFAVDPETDEVHLFADAPGKLESLVWDERSHQLLATEDLAGTILKWELTPPESRKEYALDHARFEAPRTPRYIPERCPDFLAKLMAFGGIDLHKGGEALSFATFARHVPLVAVDAVATPIGPVDTVSKDPIVRLQAAVFHPSDITMPGLPHSGPLAIITATTRSGKVIKTGLKEVSAAVADFAALFVQAAGTMRVTVPFPGPIGVSEKGICNLHLMGMGEMPDFHIVLNPIEPAASYMLVDDGRNGIQQYQLAGPHGESLAGDMVISYSKELSTQAQWLGRDERFAENTTATRMASVN